VIFILIKQAVAKARCFGKRIHICLSWYIPACP